jgi:hydrogenase-4 component E
VSAWLPWLLVGLALGVVLVRRRATGVWLIAAQSLALGAAALHEADAGSAASWTAAAILVVRALGLPLVLRWVVAQTREPTRIGSEASTLARLVLAALALVAAVALVPDVGLDRPGSTHGAVALVVLGIVVAAARRAVAFQAMGFLLAENGVYLASVSVRGGFPAVVELGLLFDLVVLVGVAAAFGARIHEEFGTSDTSILRELRD